MLLNYFDLILPILLTTSFICVIMSAGAFILSIKSWIHVKALEKSTHTVTYAPIDKEIDEANKKWATSQEAIRKQNKMYTEDIKAEMPEFEQDDFDKETYSF